MIFIKTKATRLQEDNINKFFTVMLTMGTMIVWVNGNYCVIN